MTVNRKITALALLSVVAFAVVMGVFLLTTQAADTSNTTATDTTNTTTALTDNNYTAIPGWGNGCVGFGGPGHGMGFGRRGLGGFGGFGPVEVSSEFVQNVTNIAKSDVDVQNLLAQGYNVTSVRPMIKNVVDANGYVTTKATSAIVILQNDTSGYASVLVNLEEGKVTRIVILTRKVIEKP
jgi:hypothetical protein